MPLNLTRVERSILMHQHRVLAKLEPENAEYHENAAEILQRGYYEMFGSECLGIEEDAMPRQTMLYVADVLEMYQRLQDAFDELLEDVKAEIGRDRVVFPGFNGNGEARLIGYARFLREKMERFTSVEATKDMNTHHPTAGMYGRMLSAMPMRNGLQQTPTAEEMRTVLDAQRGQAAA